MFEDRLRKDEEERERGKKKKKKKNDDDSSELENSCSLTLPFSSLPEVFCVHCVRKKGREGERKERKPLSDWAKVRPNFSRLKYVRSGRRKRKR